MTDFRAEAARHASFDTIRYAQVWEDADILLEALDIQPHDVCLSIASAGDNVLSLVSKGPQRVLAIDLNPAQLACLALRVAAFRHLEHSQILELVGARPSSRRTDYYQQCRSSLSHDEQTFLDARMKLIKNGIGHGGKFERYFCYFRRCILPCILNKRQVEELLAQKSSQERMTFFLKHIDTWRWRLLLRLFFSQTVMGCLGRSPALFKYARTSISAQVADRSRHALTELEPDKNSYLQWILTGTFQTALPHYLRAENFESIRRNLHCLEWRHASLETYLSSAADICPSKFNLSDVFEYMSEENAQKLLNVISRSARPSSRLAYWNMLVPRRSHSPRLKRLDEQSDRLHRLDKAFFYSAFHVDEVTE